MCLLFSSQLIFTINYFLVNIKRYLYINIILIDLELFWSYMKLDGHGITK